MPLNSLLQPIPQRNRWSPPQLLFRQRNLRPSNQRIISPTWLIRNRNRRLPRCLSHKPSHQIDEFLDSILRVIPNIHRPLAIATIHQRIKTPHAIRDILEGPCCLSVAGNCQFLAGKCGSNEIRDYAAITCAHSRAVCVEDACYAGIHALFAVCVEEGFGCSFAFVVA